MKSAACVLQRKRQRPFQFEITPPAREAVEHWIRKLSAMSWWRPLAPRGG